MKLAPFIIVATAALLPRYVDAQAAPRDPYSCYRAKTGDSGIRFTAKFTDPLRSGIHLDDAFGETTFGVRKLEWACTAAAVGQGSVADPDSGFLGYRLRRIRKRCAPGAFNELESCTRDADCPGAACVPAPPFDRTNASNRAVHLVDAFGTARMDLLRPDILLVPASHAPANAGAPLPDPGAAPAEQRELDSYTCYRANPTRKVCASDAPFNPNGYCARDSDCATPPDFADLVSDACRPAPRHDRSTSVYTADSVAGARTYRLPRTSHVCSAADKDGEGMVDDRARMSCYVARETRRCRAGTNNEFAACRRDVDCGPAQSPGSCVRDAKFDQKDPDHRNLFFNDGLDFLASANVSIDHHRLDLVRPAIFCTPACELPPREVALSPFVVQAASVGISSTQEATRGLDVDGDPATCAPLIPGVCDPAANASDGVDNALTGLAGALNQALGAALAQRGLVLLFELDSFVDGPVDVRAVLVAPDPNDASCDIQNPNSPCTFIASASSLTADLDDGCRGVVRTAVPVTLTGTGYPGEAKVTGQAVGSEIEIVLPIGVDGVVLKLRDVIVDAVLAHDTHSISAAAGTIGGAFLESELVGALRQAGRDTQVAQGVTVGDLIDWVEATPADLVIGGEEAVSIALTVTAAPTVVVTVEPRPGFSGGFRGCSVGPVYTDRNGLRTLLALAFPALLIRLRRTKGVVVSFVTIRAWLVARKQNSASPRTSPPSRDSFSNQPRWCTGDDRPSR